MADSPDTAGAQANILLESGTNELEVLVFEIGGQSYGVNVAKVREVIPPIKVAASPSQPPCVRGIFNLRGVVLPLIDLHQYLDIEPEHLDEAHRRIIVTEFNGQRAAFLVEGVDQIYRMSWKLIRPVPETHDQTHAAVTGITEINDQLILMLDFESIFDHIAMQDKMHVTHIENSLGVDRGAKRVILAEDSRFIGQLMHQVLTNSGYEKTILYRNGFDAWSAIQEAMENDLPLPDLIVSDIEMPQMDGLALTRHVKEHADLRHIPVILFSSLVTEDTRHKGEQVGADQQIAKPQLPEMVGLIDEHFHTQSQAAA